MDGGSTEDAGGGSFAGLGGLERWRAHSKIAIWCLVLCGSVLLNATLLVAFIRRPGLRTISNRFVMNLIGSNLLAIFVLTGLLITDSCGIPALSHGGIGSTNPTTPSFCALAEGATAFVTTSSILSVLLIGVDQYLAVVDPLRYRTRIDKLKCVLLMVAVWLIALVFGALASINPQPRSLCTTTFADDSSDSGGDGQQQVSFQASLVLRNGNATESADLEIEGEISFQQVGLNASSLLRNASGKFLGHGGGATRATTYGLVYALVYALLGYLVPFLAICWIYVSIYTAARSNSERTRRNGSRPILSSGSFSEESQVHRQPGTDSSIEDFRRIPKISSLSSIDENSEACPSQITSGAGAGGGRSSRASERIDEDEAAGVVFTLGTSQVQRQRSQPADDEENAKDSTAKSKVPTAALRAKFLMTKEEEEAEEEGDRGAAAPEPTLEQLVRSKFPEVTDQRRKSSHDLMYEEMMLGSCRDKHPYEYEDEFDRSSEEEEEDEEEDPERRQREHQHEEYEEALPLSVAPVEDRRNAHSSTRSISVNFDLGEAPANGENSRMLQGCQHPGTAAGHPPPIVTITPPGQRCAAGSVPLHRVPSVKSTHGYINNLKYRISNGSLFKYREETRAARISALVIVMGLICWTPYVYVLLLRNLPGGYYDAAADSGTGRSSLDATALSFLVLATYVSPLLFGYRSRRVKRELRKFFCFKRELSYKNNRSLMAKKVLRRRHSGPTILGLDATPLDNARYNIFNCVYGNRTRWPKEKVHFVQVPETALAVETCRSSFSSGASTQISSTSTDEC